MGSVQPGMRVESEALRLAALLGQQTPPEVVGPMLASQAALIGSLDLIPGVLDFAYVSRLVKRFEQSEGLLDGLADYWSRSLSVASDALTCKYLYTPSTKSWMRVRCTTKMVTSGTTGHALWPASLAFVDNFEKMQPLLVGKRVLELGAGVGLVGRFLALQAVDITLSDTEQVLAVSRLNCPDLAAIPLDWTSPAAIDLIRPFDVLVAADIVYDHNSIGCISRLLSAKATCILAQEVRNPDTWAAFLSALQDGGCSVTELPVDFSGWLHYDPKPLRLLHISTST